MTNKLKNHSFKAYIFFVFFISFFILSTRYPLENQQRGGDGDSWDYNVQVNHINTEGEISWIINPLSYYGYYPPYNEVGTVTLFSSLAVPLKGIITSRCNTILSEKIGTTFTSADN